MHVDLNSDLGEGFGVYTIGNDDNVLKSVTSANVACGFHAGDPLIMKNTIQKAMKHNVAIGAHPGLSDFAGFGRRNLAISPDEAYAIVVYQIGALAGMAKSQGAQIQHVKPHGALYNMAAVDQKLAMAIAKAVYDVNPDYILYGLANSYLTKAGEIVGLRVAHEVFADRAYTPEGTLVSRSEVGAVLDSEIESLNQVVQMVTTGTVTAIDGSTVPIKADTICIHGDTPKAVAFSKNIRARLAQEDIKVRSFQN
jgi:UPF0271 protein